MIEVVLIKDVAGLGVQGQIVKVKDGYAINFLFKKGLARRATPQDLEKAKDTQRYVQSLTLDKQEFLNKVEEVIKERLNGKLIIERQAAASGTLYDAIEPQDIKDMLKQSIKEFNGVTFDINVTDGRIKKVGQFVVEVVVKDNNKKFPLIVEVVSAQKTRLKSSSMEVPNKSKKSK